MLPRRQAEQPRIGPPPRRRISRAVAKPTARADGTPFTAQPVRPTNRRNTNLEGPAYAHYAQLRRWEETPLQFKDASSPPLIARPQAVALRQKHNILVKLFPSSFYFSATESDLTAPHSLPPVRFTTYRRPMRRARSQPELRTLPSAPVARVSVYASCVARRTGCFS